ncbi:MAG: trypsin-like peptidase domain-containing protein [Verrucomicrobiia bacterium]
MERKKTMGVRLRVWGRVWVVWAALAWTAGATPPEEEVLVRTVAGVLPTVVNIYTESFVEVADPYDLFIERFFGGGVYGSGRTLRKPVRSLGSGLIVSPDGYIVTNAHVVQRAREVTIKVTLHDKTDHEARVLRAVEDLDLALIKIDSNRPLAHFDLNRLSPNLLAQTVVAIGNPVGYESSVSKGILSARDRTLRFGDMVMEGLLQTDAAINPGNSGGPLIDGAGQLVGLSTAKMGTVPGENRLIQVENIGFAIPGERVKAFVEESVAIATGRLPPPPEEALNEVLFEKFGLRLQELTPDLARAFGIRMGTGMIVAQVRAGTPAEQAGIERGMVVTAIGSQRVAREEDLPRALARAKSGDPVTFTILFRVRQGALQSARIAQVTLRSL